MKKYLRILFLLLYFCNLSFTQEKIPLSHSVYTGWKELQSPLISNDGNWVSFEINPLRGDGNINLFNLPEKKSVSFNRGKSGVFSPNSNYFAFRATSPFDSTRKDKLSKKKIEDLNKDTLMIFSFSDRKSKKYPNLKSFKIPEKASDWIIVQFDKENKKGKDSTKKVIDDSIKPKKIAKDTSKVKKEGTRLLILNPITNKEYEFQNVFESIISKNGKSVLFTSAAKDSLDSCSVYIFKTKEEKAERIFYKNGFVKFPTLDEKGDQAAFLYSPDTASIKSYNIFYFDLEDNKSICIVDTLNPSLPKGFTVSENHVLMFSQNGGKLFYGTSPKPIPEPKDTLLPEEKAVFDLWSWTDGLVQPQQLKEVQTEKKRSYLSVYNFPDKPSYKLLSFGGKFATQLADDSMEMVQTINKGNENVALGSTKRPYQKFVSWDQEYSDYFIVNLKNGNRKQILNKFGSTVRMSPDGNNVVWYEFSDSSWYSMNVEDIFKSKSKNNLTKINLTKKIKSPFYNVEFDMPDDPPPIGLVGFSEKEVLLYDVFDIWLCDLEGKKEPICLTKKIGEKEKIQFRYVKLDKDEEFIDLGKPILLKSFNEETKNDGFYILKNSNLTKLIDEPYRYSNPTKSKDSEKLIWTKCNFKTFPDLWISDLSFNSSEKISNANPQQAKYLWGDVELVDWKDNNGKELKGLLFKPENFDKTKKYPMISYFYERNSDNLNTHYIPSPSRSIINIPFFVSNGYIVFVPDITYKVGYPGQSAFDAIVSGTLAMVEKGFIDKDRMGIQGQSWGGYQVAYLITRTNLYAAAGAGALVSNMTSAYGGIRWGTGLSREFQYEKSQSRIGGTLWEKPLNYIENSPLFFVNKIQTPLFMTHNDQDDAVPWYQGIEFYSALRRLNKPVWFVNYNNDAHNLKGESWGNRVDLSIRLSQFFDHYLQNKPMPKWMKEGIPATKKGIQYGYELE